MTVLLPPTWLLSAVFNFNVLQFIHDLFTGYASLMTLLKSCMWHMNSCPMGMPKTTKFDPLLLSYDVQGCSLMQLTHAAYKASTTSYSVPYSGMRRIVHFHLTDKAEGRWGHRNRKLLEVIPFLE